MSENPTNSMQSDTKGGAVENWDRLVHKNVRTADNQGFGKVVAIPDDQDTIIISSQSGSDQYRLPRSAVSGFNGAEVMLGITLDEMGAYRVEEANEIEAHPSNVVSKGSGKAVAEEGARERTVPLIEERLNVKKRTKTEEARIRKEAVKETKTLEVPLTHEELVIERRPASGNSSAEPPSESGEELRISLDKEEVEVTKEPYVKEELVIRTEPRTETKTVTETLTSERISGNDLPPSQEP
ncbi:MAG TPA: YsnF/AvaK domain-containing protein [Nitrososphaera sp.]|nr:YsnF/AvaK domain-containing protein [Nitrososphaera sp.]